MFKEISKEVICYNEKFQPVYNNSKDLSVKISREKVNEFITKITLKYTNNSKNTIKYIPFYQAVTKGECDFYMIPCVNYNGNGFGNGQEPKNMQTDDEPWIFSSDRTGVPGCSIVESRGECIALFGELVDGKTSSSASVFTHNGYICQKIFFSHIEYPKCYLRKFAYGEPIIELLNIQPNESQAFCCYEYVCCKKDVYAYSYLFDYLCCNTQKYKSAFTVEQVKKQCLYFLNLMIEKNQNYTLSNIGLLPDGEHKLGNENSKYCYRKTNKYEIGWCGQNITVAEMMLRSYLETNDKEKFLLCKDIIHSWATLKHKSGLFSVNFDCEHTEKEYIDSCNEGWLLYKLGVIAHLISENLDKFDDNDIYNFLNEIKDYIKDICSLYFTKFPFELPQIVYPEGSIAVKDGAAGAVLNLGIIYAYSIFQDKIYLEFGTRYFLSYYKKYLSNSVCAGGALDTYCIDKESAGPLLRCSLLLYKYTKNEEYLKMAENIAHYLMTWAFYFNVPFDKLTDCGQLNIKTVGGTAVSAAHHHIDCWGVFYVPDMLELYELTINKAYLLHAQDLWNFTLQYISDGSLKLHDMVRPLGAQNEAVFQCNWHSESESKGLLNDWLVIWVKTFQLDVIYSDSFLRHIDFFN